MCVNCSCQDANKTLIPISALLFLSDCVVVSLFQHGGVYVKRSAKFNEKAMKKKLLSQTQSGAPVRDTVC